MKGFGTFVLIVEGLLLKHHTRMAFAPLGSGKLIGKRRCDLRQIGGTTSPRPEPACHGSEVHCFAAAVVRSDLRSGQA